MIEIDKPTNQQDSGSSRKDSCHKSITITMPSLILVLLIVIPWLTGLVYAEPGWDKVFAYFPMYAWYLTTKHLMMFVGLI